MTIQKENSLGTAVVRAAGLVLLMNLFSRVFGFVRDAVIAREFGASGATDAYLVAYTLPYALQAVLGMAFISVVVPLVTAYLVKEQQAEAWRAVSILFNWTVVLLVGITLLGILFAPWLIKLLAPGFGEETYSLTVLLTRIIFPSIVFMGAGMLITGVLNAGGVFVIPAFAPAFANVIVILSVLLLAGVYRVQGLAVGTVIAFIGFLLIQLPSLKRLGFRWRWDWDRHHPALKHAGTTLIPVTLAIAINQVYLAINRIFASGLEPGSITALDFAYRLMALPLGVFVAAVATAIFPAFSRAAAAGDGKGLSETLVKGMALVTLISIPCAVGLMVIREPLVQLVFERGAFDAYATARTAEALWYFAMGLWAVGANTVVTRAYYAQNRVRIPLLVGISCAGINVLLSILLLPKLGHAGLALANSLSATVSILCLLGLFYRSYWQQSLSGLALPLAKALIASGGMAVLLTLVRPYLMSGIPMTGTMGLVVELAVLVSLGALVYGLLLVVLKTRELGLIKTVLRRRSS